MARRKIRRDFFDRDSDVVARELLGQWIVVRSGVHTLSTMISETEAYGGSDDPASHAYRGRTPRSEIMFGPPGFLYVYLIYGVHWCMNVVTGPSGNASAVLLRAGELSNGHALLGPGNLTRGLGISGGDTGVDCCGPRSGRVVFEMNSTPINELTIGRSRRIGLTKGVERESRYFLVDNETPVLRDRRRIGGPRDTGSV
jgi:DNA-3-methyladenine glycosylase